ncbi:response regulator transcription factor, partial [Tetragenococcus solitarius]|uniref:response regulator transcription factor n=2 Tax=Tetragenococcus solitarius TaxID=71453 RepID=UPI0031D6A51E
QKSANHSLKILLYFRVHLTGCPSLGANDYLVKPFSPNELVARVKAHIARYQSIQPNPTTSILEIQDIRIDQSAHKVFVLEQEVIFTNKEFALLLFLAEHPNRVWNKEELFEKIWGFDVLDTEVSTVVVHIKRIREKLKQANLSSSPIETIWGSGYRFNH